MSASLSQLNTYCWPCAFPLRCCCCCYFLLVLGIVVNDAADVSACTAVLLALLQAPVPMSEALKSGELLCDNDRYNDRYCSPPGKRS